jgi:hypothetical protein
MIKIRKRADFSCIDLPREETEEGKEAPVPMAYRPLNRPASAWALDFKMQDGSFIKGEGEIAAGEVVESRTYDLAFDTLWRGVVSAIKGMSEKMDKRLKDSGQINT